MLEDVGGAFGTGMVWDGRNEEQGRGSDVVVDGLVVVLWKWKILKIPQFDEKKEYLC